MVAKMEDRKISLEVDGVRYTFHIEEFTDRELRELKELTLKILYALYDKRDGIYRNLRLISGELDRRTNDAAAITHMK